MDTIKDEGKGQERERAPPAGSPFHKGKKSCPWHPQQTWGDISLTRHVTWPPLAAQEAGEAKLAFFFPLTRKTVKYQDNPAFLENVQPLL